MTIQLEALLQSLLLFRCRVLKGGEEDIEQGDEGRKGKDDLDRVDSQLNGRQRLVFLSDGRHGCSRYLV